MKNLLKVMPCALLVISSYAYAWEVELGVGSTGSSDTTVRLAMNKQWESKFLESSAGYLSGYWSLAYTHWEKGQYGKDVGSLSFSPVLTYNFYTDSGFEPFIELGVGIAAFSKTKVGNKNLGSAFNFEDRVGVGAHFGDHTIGARAMHYSNAGLKSPNDGIESYALYYSYRF